MKKILFLINPVSGKLAGNSLKDCIISELRGVLESDSFDIEYSARDIENQCKNLFSNYEIVVIAGGDGTVSQVIKVIAAMEIKPKLGIIPIGTGNDLANSVGILHLYKSQGLGALLKVIQRCKVVNMDILSLGNSFVFTNYFGIGNDAKTSVDFDRLRYVPFFRSICSSFFNKAFYGILGLKNIFYKIPFGVEISYENEHSKTEVISFKKGLREIVISNANVYAGMELSSKCRIDDGKFEVTVLRGIWEWLHIFFCMLLKKPLDTIFPKVMQFQTHSLELKFTGGTFCQVDGEMYNGFDNVEKKLSVTVVSSCEVIVP